MRSVGNAHIVAWVQVKLVIPVSKSGLIDLHSPPTPHILVCVHIPHRICTASSTLSSQEFWDIQYHHWLWHYMSHLQVLIKHIKCKNCIKIFLRNMKLKVTLQIRAEGFFAFATLEKTHIDNLHMDRKRVPTSVCMDHTSKKYIYREIKNKIKEADEQDTKTIRMYHSAVMVIWSWGTVTFERSDKAWTQQSRPSRETFCCTTIRYFVQDAIKHTHQNTSNSQFPIKSLDRAHRESFQHGFSLS